MSVVQETGARCARYRGRDESGYADKPFIVADNQPIGDDQAAHLVLVAPASGNDAGAPAPLGPVCGGTYRVIRAQAVPPIRIAPRTANA